MMPGWSALWITISGYFDLETQCSNRLTTPSAQVVVTYVAGTVCYPCLRAGPKYFGAPGGI